MRWRPCAFFNLPLGNCAPAGLGQTQMHLPSKMRVSAAGPWVRVGLYRALPLATRISTSFLFPSRCSPHIATIFGIGNGEGRGRDARTITHVERFGTARKMCIVRQSSYQRDEQHGDGVSWRGSGNSGIDFNIAKEIAKILARRNLRLVLHFDLNKTLLMVDPAGGKTQSQVLKCVFTRLLGLSWPL